MHLQLYQNYINFIIDYDFLLAKLPNTPARTGSQRSSQNTPRSQLSQNSQPTSQNTTVDDEMMDDDLCMAAMETA